MSKGIFGFNQKGLGKGEIERLKRAEYFSNPAWLHRTTEETPATHCGNCVFFNHVFDGHDYCNEPTIEAPVDDSACCRLWRPNARIEAQLDGRL